MANSGKDKPGNFANDREKASEAGKKGGQASGGQHPHTADKSTSGGQGSGRSGNFADDREKASEAGKKGGEHSGGGRKS
ncbi:general stress protein [Pseudomonas sp. H1h]|uniref:general stress protein n=1 Tax=Pseudomonas sp. H1h TaxID=1397280 RepID=UPI0009E03640|nr:general stress protein [Pseudomonas sp. H1h]